MPAQATTALRDTPLSFAEVILKTELYDWQAEILFAIEKGSTRNRIKMAVVAPNAAEKSTRIVAIAALRWHYKIKATYETIPIPDSLRNDPCQTLHRFLRLAFASAEKAKPRGN
jgi:hypothetical protein